ncbi:MAG: hypothetical protein CBE00_01075 [Planctomycetaceae bacterium TMED240]|nr:hypothetical protein [Rhodopirellula sp.]OUX08629.1 MAG: hypothetical protein CBE00_01075 [Planctomycetaceae bacterium TMED240]
MDRRWQLKHFPLQLFKCHLPWCSTLSPTLCQILVDGKTDVVTLIVADFADSNACSGYPPFAVGVSQPFQEANTGSANLHADVT